LINNFSFFSRILETNDVQDMISHSGLDMNMCGHIPLDSFVDKIHLDIDEKKHFANHPRSSNFVSQIKSEITRKARPDSKITIEVGSEANENLKMKKAEFIKETTKFVPNSPLELKSKSELGSMNEPPAVSNCVNKFDSKSAIIIHTSNFELTHKIETFSAEKQADKNLAIVLFEGKDENKNNENSNSSKSISCSPRHGRFESDFEKDDLNDFENEITDGFLHILIENSKCEDGTLSLDKLGKSKSGMITRSQSNPCMRLESEDTDLVLEILPEYYLRTNPFVSHELNYKCTVGNKNGITRELESLKEE
jgi:hypothetical protein